MNSRSKVSLKSPLNVLGALVVLMALCFQLLAGTHLLSSNELPDFDTVSCVIEKDAENKIEDFVSLKNPGIYQAFFRHTHTVTVALHLNKGLTNMFGRTSVPHANQIRYILFQNPKLHCTV